MVYNPNNKVTTLETPYLSLVNRADPEWGRRKFWDVEYEFAGKTFYANPQVRGAYNDFSNIYAVGQPHGPIDPVVQAAHPMLYGIATDGWA